jgi:hypothetical protein
MKGLTVDDLLPLQDFATRRRELFDAHTRYVDRYRRVRIGPQVTLLFENRQTLWFRLQEVLRVARLSEPARVQQELDLYNRLLPASGRLQAALLIGVPDEAQMPAELTRWQQLRGEDLSLHIADARIPADLLTCRPEDRCIGTAHWVQFFLDAPSRRLLADQRNLVHCAVSLGEYHHDSAPLGDDVRQSLLDDLSLSDRDG